MTEERFEGDGSALPSGGLSLAVIRAGDSGGISGGIPASLSAVPVDVASWHDLLRFGFPQKGLPPQVNEWRAANCGRLVAPFARLRTARRLRLPHIHGRLSLAIIRANGDVIDLGLASFRVVTTAGVNYLAGCFPNTNEPEVFKYHGLGTGTNAEAIGDTALQTELTTQYNPDNTRATGSQAAATNVYTTVGTNTVDAAAAVTEHGIFSQAATGGGTLLDRSVFSVVNLANGDGLQATYAFTINAGG